MTATANKSNHRSHSISGDLVLSDQNSGRPGSNEGFSFCIDAVEVSRSTMLQTTERQVKKERKKGDNNVLQTVSRFEGNSN